MTINTGINPNIRRPITAYQLVAGVPGRAPAPLTPRVLVMGTMGTAGTATANVVQPINDPVETDGLFGIGTPLALACRAAFDQASALGGGPQLFAVGVAQPAGATEARTLTFTGPALSSGSVVIEIAGVAISIGASVGDGAAAIATAVNAAIGAKLANIPVTSTVLGGVVTCTFTVRGAEGADLVIRALKLPTNVGCTIAVGTAGSGVPDETTALANAAALDLDMIASGYHATGNLTNTVSHVNATWLPTEKRFRWVLHADAGSVGNTSTLAGTANLPGVVVFAARGIKALPGVITAAAAVRALAVDRPNANLDGATLRLPPPDEGAGYTTGEVETLLAAGATPITAIVDQTTRIQTPGQAQIVKLVTSFTTQGGQPSEASRDIAISRVQVAFARQLDIAYASRFGAGAFNSQGALADATSKARIQDMIATVSLAAEGARWIANAAATIANMVLEFDPATPGRILADIPITVVVGLHQVFVVIRSSF